MRISKRIAAATLRSRSGLTFQASHAWAKNLGNVGGDAPTFFNQEVIYGTSVANRFDLSANRGNMAGTRRNRFLLSAVYELPSGTESQIPFAHESDFRSGVWRMVYQHHQLADGTVSDADDEFELRSRKPESFLSRQLATPRLHRQRQHRKSRNRKHVQHRCCNPIPAGPVGNCGVGILDGPGTATIAAGLSKTFHLKERLRMRFESTFTNLFNHPNFAAPPTNVTSWSFGVVLSMQSAENSGNRTGQLSLRLDF